MKALVVDDVAINRQLLTIFLDGKAKIISAASGEEAIEKTEEALASGDYFDLICMDISMPGMDGHETLKQIRERESTHGAARAVTFMVTGSSCPDDMFNALVEGECDDYLTKPLIQRTFNELLSKHGLC